MAFDQIQHVFVLMFENHSFDHLLGFSGISGTDAATGLATTVNGLSETEAHTYNGVTATVSQPADYAKVVDPGHEFSDVLCQLCGSDATTHRVGPTLLLIVRFHGVLRGGLC